MSSSKSSNNYIDFNIHTPACPRQPYKPNFSKISSSSSKSKTSKKRATSI